MTAFTYRFAPAMRLSEAPGPNRSAGARPATSARSGSWIGPRRAGAGGSTRTRPAPATCSTMTIHRIDFALDLVGPLARILRRGGPLCPPDPESGRLALPAVGRGRLVVHRRRVRQRAPPGVWEGTTLAKGYGRNGFGHEWAEINGSEGLGRLPPPRAQHDPPRPDRARPGTCPGPQRVPQARGPAPATLIKASPRPCSATTWSGEFVSAIVGRTRGGPQLRRRPERANRGRRGARILRAAGLGRDAPCGPVSAPFDIDNRPNHRSSRPCPAACDPAGD